MAPTVTCKSWQLRRWYIRTGRVQHSLVSADWSLAVLTLIDWLIYLSIFLAFIGPSYFSRNLSRFHRLSAWMSVYVCRTVELYFSTDFRITLQKCAVSLKSLSSSRSARQQNHGSLQGENVSSTKAAAVLYHIIVLICSSLTTTAAAMFTQQTF